MAEHIKKPQLNMNQKLELTWIGKGEEDVLEPRILIENTKYSYGDPHTDNIIIHGDNLLALKSLVASGYAGKVKCIYIDPPYNTGNAFDKYDDNVEHSIWLSLMKQRLELLRELLCPDGVLCMQLDDMEVHYAKVMTDEIFQRQNFVCSIAIKSSTPSGLKTTHKEKTIIKQKDTMLVYKKSDSLRIKPAYISRGFWDPHFSKFLHKDTLEVENLIDILIAQGIVPAGTSNSSIQITPKFQKFYRMHKDEIFQTQPVMPEQHKRLSRDNPNQVYSYTDENGQMNYAMNGRRFSFLSSSMSELEDGSYDMATLLCDFWSDIDFQNTQNEGGVAFPASKKPERLLLRVLKMFTSPGDLVLDSFLGSGTTAAVAHKMGRRYIGIELGNHAYTHCVPRLQKVIDGTDQGGITATMGWSGGGGYRFYELAPTLLNKDENGVMVISPEYNAEMLAAAMAMHEGFCYAPDPDVFWKQGHSTEHDFIYTTTQHLTIETMEYIDSLLGEDETILICCASHSAGLVNRFPRITVKRIPRMLLGRCVFDPEKNYNLNIITLPEVADQDDEDDE